MFECSNRDTQVHGSVEIVNGYSDSCKGRTVSDRVDKAFIHVTNVI